MDGVIADTTELHFRAWRDIAEELGIHLNREDNETLKGLVAKDYLETILSWDQLEMDANEIQEWIEKKRTLFMNYASRLSPDDLFPGVLDFLDLLRDVGFYRMVASASRHTSFVLEKLQVQHYFQAVYDGNSGLRGKPAPDLFLAAAAACQCEPSECIVFEDSHVGVEAARAGSFWTVGVGDGELLSGAHVVIQGFDEISLPGLIANIHMKHYNQ